MVWGIEKTVMRWTTLTTSWVCLLLGAVAACSVWFVDWNHGSSAWQDVLGFFGIPCIAYVGFATGLEAVGNKARSAWFPFIIHAAVVGFAAISFVRCSTQ